MIALIDVIVDRGAPVMANRVFATARKMFNWACERGTLETSPFDRVKERRHRRPSATARIHDAELSLIWRAAHRSAIRSGRSSSS